MIASTTPDYPAIVEQYCLDVESGERVAGNFEKLAIARYRLDREESLTRGYRFDEAIATKSCLFYPLVCRHTMGRWAGEPFYLSPWQAFCEWNISGFRSVDDNTRRFLKVFITVARKNGKTTFGGAKANQLTFCDVPAEKVGRGYCAATTQAQAALLWSEAARMIAAAPWLGRASKVTGEQNIKGGLIRVTAGGQVGTTFQPLGSDSRTTDGLNPSFVLKDELHEWRQKHRGLHEKLSTGGASRAQPLELIFTTAGSDDSEIWIEELEFYKRVLEAAARGDVIDDTAFGMIYEIDQADDPLDPACWPKANPNLGVSCSLKYLKMKAAEAVVKPSFYTAFVRYNTNRRVGSFEQAYPETLWNRGEVTFPEPVPGDLCFVSFDVGRTNDWAGWAAVFPQQFTDSNGNSRWRYKIKSKAYCCKGPNVTTNYGDPPYSGWIAEGLLGFQTDEILDVAELKADILELQKSYEVRSVPYDDSYAKELALDLHNNYGLPVFSFFQTHLRYNEPLIAFENALTEGLIDHGNCPVLNFQSGNCQYNYDAKGRRMLDKGNHQRWKKIDAMVAVIMAFGEAIYAAKHEANDDILIG